MKRVPSLNGSPPAPEKTTDRPTFPGPNEEWDRLSPCWPHVRRLSGVYFWIALAVLVGLGLVTGYCTWHCIQPTTLAGEILVILGILVFWGAAVVAFAGWAMRRETRRADSRTPDVTQGR